MRRLAAIAIGLVSALLATALPAVAEQAPPPRTGFEARNGATWTSLQEEAAFLRAVDARSRRAEVEVIGHTAQGRPLRMVRLGAPMPRPRVQALREPTLLLLCSQHGNEPAPREGCLQTLRDLAFTDKPALVELLERQTVLVIPTANPDGRKANTRGNARGADINRDHLNLRTLEGEAIAETLRDWSPDVALDMHEYGPSLPVVYDDELLFLWPRNLNVDEGVRALAKTLGREYIAPGAERAGFSADEYGVLSADPDGYGGRDYHLAQIAGSGDEGIARNLVGLRHTMTLLVESAVTADPRNGVREAIDDSALRRRRVAIHLQAATDALRFMRDLGSTSEHTSDQAAANKTREGRERSAPVYFDGQDQDRTAAQNGNAEPSTIADPPPCGYRLTSAQRQAVKPTLEMHGIEVDARPDGTAYVSMAQPAEPVIPLLLDARGQRHAVTADPVTSCSTGPGR